MELDVKERVLVSWWLVEITDALWVGNSLVGRGSVTLLLDC